MRWWWCSYEANSQAASLVLQIAWYLRNKIGWLLVGTGSEPKALYMLSMSLAIDDINGNRQEIHLNSDRIFEDLSHGNFI